MIKDRSTFFSYLLYSSLLFLGYFILGIIVKLNLYPTLKFENIWDIEHYFWIKENGYNGFRVVFFPLFPLIWKVTNFSLLGISIFNGSMFLIGVSYFSSVIKPPITSFLLLISIFSSLFYFMPYSESVFYVSIVFSCLALYLNKKAYSLGFFTASLTRPASTILVPAILLLALRENVISKNRNSNSIFIRLIIATVIGLIIIMIANYITTSNPFSFYINQKIWDSELGIPNLPFTSWGPWLAMKLDFIALSTVLYFLFLFFREKHYLKSDLLLEFSLLYFTGFLILTLAFRGGSLHSFNRFLFCTPMFLYCGYRLFTKPKGKVLHAFQLYLFLTILSFTAGSYLHIQTFLYFQITIIYFTGFVECIRRSEKFKPFHVLFLLGNGIIIAYLFLEFYSGTWIG